MSADHGSHVSIWFGRPSYRRCVAWLVIFILLPPMSQLGVCAYESTYEVVLKLIDSWPEVPRIILSSAGPSSAGIGVVSPAVVHVSNASAPLPAFKVCCGCFAEFRFMCLAVSSLLHLPSSVCCECCPALQSVRPLPPEGFQMRSHAAQVGFALVAFFARCVAA